MPLYGHELSEEIDPFQAGLGWAVKLDKGDFRGREALGQTAKGRRPALNASAWNSAANASLARERAVQAAGNAIGVVTSGTFAPTLHKTIAMAYVEPAFAKAGTAVPGGYPRQRRGGTRRGVAVLQAVINDGDLHDPQESALRDVPTSGPAWKATPARSASPRSPSSN